VTVLEQHGPGRVADGRPGRAPARAGTPAVVVGVLLLGLAVVAASVVVGSRWVGVEALLDGSHPHHAVYAARVERTLLALCVGAALGLAGACLQGLTRNPLADPGILGLNAGACLAMVLAISVLGISRLEEYVWFAFAGAAAAAVLVHAIASLGRDGATPVKIAI
jgi:iron complex transport system permease protein